MRAKFPSNELANGKAASLPNSRSLVGVAALFLVKKCITKEEERKKNAHVPLGLGVGRWCETGDITIAAIFINTKKTVENTIPGLLIDRGLR